MIATLLVTLFAGAAILAVGSMIASWRSFGARFGELRQELRASQEPLTVRYAWRDSAAPRSSAVIYNLDFTARADGLPFHPELRHDLPVAA